MLPESKSLPVLETCISRAEMQSGLKVTMTTIAINRRDLCIVILFPLSHLLNSEVIPVQSNIDKRHNCTSCKFFQSAQHVHSIGQCLTHLSCSRPFLLPGRFLTGLRVPTFSYCFLLKASFLSTSNFTADSDKASTKNNFIVSFSAICKGKIILSLIFILLFCIATIVTA